MTSNTIFQFSPRFLCHVVSLSWLSPNTRMHEQPTVHFPHPVIRTWYEIPRSQLVIIHNLSVFAHEIKTLDPYMVRDPKISTCDDTQPSVFVHEIKTFETDKIPSRILTWKPTTFLSHTSSRQTCSDIVTSSVGYFLVVTSSVVYFLYSLFKRSCVTVLPPDSYD